jgi:hypothetical protein
MSDPAEGISAESATKKRGRPRLLSPQQETRCRFVAGSNSSRRTIQEKHYLLCGIELLGRGKDPRFFWLIEANAAGNDFIRWRQSLLAEIGRTAEPYSDAAEVAERIATELCEIKPTARVGIELVRRYRLSLRDKPSERDSDQHVDAIVEALRRTLNTYLAAQPDAGLGHGIRALEILTVACRSDAEG